MPDPVTNAQTLGYQFEKVRNKITLLLQQDETLYSEFKKRTDVEVVSSRNMRIPIRPLAGGLFSQFSPAGTDMGRGSGTTTDVFQLTPVYFVHAVEINKDAEAATNSKQKAIEDVGKTELQFALKQIRTNIEALLNTDGSGTLDTATAANTGTVVPVTNANQFQDDQYVLFQNGLGTAALGGQAYQILSSDSINKQLTFKTALPGGITNGTLLLVNGAPGVASSSLFGTAYLNTSATTGTFFQIARTAYPGKITTPNVNFNGAPLTPQAARLGFQLMRRAMGADAPSLNKLKFHMGLDMEAAWENTGLVVTSIIQNQLKGDTSQDMLQKDAPKTFCGRPMLVSIHAKPQRIDGLPFECLGRAESQPVDFMDWGGQTMLPVTGQSGGYSAATIFYLWTGFQTFTDNPRAALFYSNIASPSGY